MENDVRVHGYGDASHLKCEQCGGRFDSTKHQSLCVVLKDPSVGWMEQIAELQASLKKLCDERNILLLQNDRLRKMLNDIRSRVWCDSSELAVEILRRIEDGTVIEKPKSEKALCGQWEPGLGPCVAIVPCEAHAIKRVEPCQKCGVAHEPKEQPFCSE